MSCPYYWWDHGYACRKTGKNVNEDMYSKYCNTYTYSDDCPIYKGKSSSDSSGCYLTSACVVALGKPDDCHELTTLRRFRDTYMKDDAERAADVCRYYHTAPKIVAAIDALENAGDIYAAMYDELVLPCVKMIETGDLAGAYTLYRDTAEALGNKYLGCFSR